MCCSEGEERLDEHEKLKRLELADGVGAAINAFVSRAAKAGEVIWAGKAVQQLRAEMPDTEISPAELAEAIFRAAAEQGVPITVEKVD